MKSLKKNSTIRDYSKIYKAGGIKGHIYEPTISIIANLKNIKNNIIGDLLKILKLTLIQASLQVFV